MAEHVQRIVERGRELWRARWDCDPLDWRDEDYVRYAISQAVHEALAPTR